MNHPELFVLQKTIPGRFPIATGRVNNEEAPDENVSGRGELFVSFFSAKQTIVIAKDDIPEWEQLIPASGTAARWDPNRMNPGDGRVSLEHLFWLTNPLLSANLEL